MAKFRFSHSSPQSHSNPQQHSAPSQQSAPDQPLRPQQLSSDQPSDPRPQSYLRNPVYRAAYRYHFEHYGSRFSGTGESCRNATLLAGVACVTGALYSVANRRHDGDPFEFALCAGLAACGLFVALRQGSSWRHFSRLARSFARSAIDGNLKSFDGGEPLSPATATNQVPALFHAVYPWR